MKVEIEERYSSLQEESFAKSKKIKKVSNELKDARAELKDLEEDHQRQMEGMLEDCRQLKKVRPCREKFDNERITIMIKV